MQPQPVSFRLDPALKEQAVKHCQERDLRLAQVLRAALKQYLADNA